jgi:uncharacterized membrane protein YvlD (DUF360 family)
MRLPSRGDCVRLLLAWAASALALMVAAAVLPGLSATTPWAYVAVAAVAGVVGLLLRPVMVELSARVGWILVLPLALVGQAVIMHVALTVVPGVSSRLGTALAASWISAAVGTAVAWMSTAGTDDGLVTSLNRRGRRVSIEDPDVDGFVFVQLDGVPFPVLQWAVRSGGVPTIRRWLSSGAYELREWTPQLPCTTPASQLGILHGTVDGVPAFRWYDRELGRVLVANRPADARIIEARAGDGGGLLAHDGVSISNLFTGGAARSLMTMSALTPGRGSTDTRRTFAWFLASPSGFMRSFSRATAEIGKERWQARRQERRRLDPRMHRSWTFAVLRATTNALLRDLNTALVAEEMRRGTHTVYVDYVDYDEIAHHAGMFRPESLAALDGLDRVLDSLERLAEGAGRRYRIVVLSDHGQSQGSPFATRFGHDLAALCSDLMARDVVACADPVEGWGRAEALAGDVAGGGLVGRLGARAEDRLSHQLATADERVEDVVVLGSGNLGLLYVPGPRRLTLDDLDLGWPRLVSGLAAHPGVGFVAGVDDQGTPWAIGSAGRRDLSTGLVQGDDPLTPFGEHAPRVLQRAVMMAEAPDLYVNSAVDAATDDVAAFEDLVGAHGGLGGWQDRAVLLAPRDLATGLPERIEGADRLHEALVAMLASRGQHLSSADPDRAGAT